MGEREEGVGWGVPVFESEPSDHLNSCSSCVIAWFFLVTALFSLSVQDAIHRIKVTFNMEFDDVYQKKEQEIAKIKEKNKRISKILSDLDLEEPMVEPVMSVYEKPERLLTVEDSEVREQFARQGTPYSL